MVSSVASISTLVAVQQDLRSQDYLWRGIFTHDVDSITHSSGSTESPARAAVTRSELISHLGKVINSVHITP